MTMIGASATLGVALMPTMEEGQVRGANDGGSAFVIPEQSQNKEAAWALTEFLFGRGRSWARPSIRPALPARLSWAARPLADGVLPQACP